MPSFLDTVKGIFFDDEDDRAAYAVGAALPITSVLSGLDDKLKGSSAYTPKFAPERLVTTAEPDIFSFLRTNMDIDPATKVYLDPAGKSSYSHSDNRVRVALEKFLDPAGNTIEGARPSFLAHELGHATVRSPSASFLRKALQSSDSYTRNGAAYRSRITDIPLVGQALLPGVIGMSGATPLQAALIGGGLQGLLQAPVLAEEAYASYRGLKALKALEEAKRYGIDMAVAKGNLTEAFKTYGASAGHRVGSAALGAALVASSPQIYQTINEYLE